MARTLLNIDANTKTVKGQKRGYLTGILYLAPSNESGAINVCPSASAGCRAACLYTAGRGTMSNVREARIKKTLWFHKDQEGFLKTLREDIDYLIRKAKKENMIPAIRLNGTSDIEWEKLGIIQEYPDVQFYDYTKRFARMLPNSLAQSLPNYQLTFSRSEKNHAHCEIVAGLKKNIAVVFSSKNYPETYLGLPVVNGDQDDLRFLDPKGVIVGLYAKGKGRKDESGFVVNA